MSKSVKRLYNQFIPENYKLEISIDSDDMEFSGSVIITGKKTGRPSKRITFHQNGLKIIAASVRKFDKNSASDLKVSRVNNQNSLQEVRIHTESNVLPGLYEIRLEFTAKITDKMNGLYPCYFEHEGKTKKLFATQFESHHAREVFPCIDEPEAKATFDLALATSDGIQVISNTPVLSQESLDKNRLLTTFEQTPVMSTYLLAFVCGEMHFVEGKTKSGIEIKSWASITQPKEQLEYSVKEAVNILEFYESYFGTKFPLKKCDQVALPDFESGAMENWGLITYREVALLSDPVNRSIPNEQYVAMVIAHELSHQWFGNLVTMKWWNDLWLNESFASLIEHLALDNLHPEWHQWEHYTSQDVIACSNRDIYSNVQEVGVDVKHPDEIGTLFDPAIVYAKGGRLLKMMREYIGDEAFRTALQNYFTVHAYKNTSRDDLWAEMSKSSGKDIKSLMTPWLEQSGMPVLKVEKTTSTNQRKLTQSRFVLDKKDDDSLWPLPLLTDRPIGEDTLTIKSSIINVGENASSPIFNASGSGHFLVHYTDTEDLNQIIDQVKNQKASTESRINILNDLMLLARRGDNSLTDALVLVSELKDEPRDGVWALMSRALGLTQNLGELNQNVEEGLKKLRYNLANEQYKRLGWDDNKNDDPNTVLLRATILAFMIGSENEEIIDYAKKIYTSTPINKIPADRRGHVMSTVVKHVGSKEIIDKLVEEYKTNIDPDIKLSISAGLCATREEKVAERLLSEGLSKKGFVRTQDYFRWFAYLMRSKYTRNATWNWLEENWTRLEKEFGGGKSLDHFVVYSAGPLQTKEWEKKFLDFFEPKKSDVSLVRNIEIATAEIRSRVEWRNRDLPKLEQFFKSVQ